MTGDDLEAIEIAVLLEALHRRYGHDLRGFAQGGLERRIRALGPALGAARIADLVPAVLHDEAIGARVLDALWARPVDMFRSPSFFVALRERVAPALRAWPHVKVWIPCCGTGEEAYAVAIVLLEEQLLGRATVYATDPREAALATARRGIYPVDRLRDFTQGYQEAGGTRPFSDHYRASYGAAIVTPELRANVVFAQQNPTTDVAPGEMQLVILRDVLPSFGRALSARVLARCAGCLDRGGYLCLGAKDDPSLTAGVPALHVVDERARIYKAAAT